jgi:hypothetical protein
VRQQTLEAEARRNCSVKAGEDHIDTDYAIKQDICMLSATPLAALCCNPSPGFLIRARHKVSPYGAYKDST